MLNPPIPHDPTPTPLWRIASMLLLLLPILVIAGHGPCDIGLTLIALLFVGDTIRTRNWALLRTPWLCIVGLLWAYMVLRSLFVEPMGPSLGQAAAWIRFPIFAAALAYWLLPNPKLQQRFLAASLVAIAFLSIDGLVQFITGTDLLGKPYVRSAAGGEALRLTGPFANPRLGITLIWLAPVVLFHFLSLRTLSRPRYAAVVALTILVGVTVFLSGERAALLVTLGVLTVAVMLLRALRKPLLIAMALLVVATATLSMLFHDTASRQFTSTMDTIGGFGQSSYQRAADIAIAVTQAHPWFGIGAKRMYRVCRDEFADRFHDCPIHAHNMYLEWLVLYGVVGLLLWLWLVGHWLRIGWAQRQRLYEPLVLALVLMIGMRIFPLMPAASQFTSWTAYPFWLAVGWLLAVLARNEREGINAEPRLTEYDATRGKSA